MSESWRDRILKEFTPQISRLTLAADPDSLLTEESMLQAIRERGFELISFEDSIAFRFAYESQYRSRWDRGVMTDLVVVLHSTRDDLRSLPFDLLQAGRQLHFNLGDLFPNLAYPIVDALDRSDLDALYQAQLDYKPGRLGENATKDFILRHVFKFTSELIKQPSDLLHLLLRQHYQGKPVPAILEERLIQILHQNELFAEWPLEQIVPDRAAFFDFLQERWPIFVQRMIHRENGVLQDEGASYSLAYPGPVHLPFEHHDVHAYIDTLFLDGLLQPITHEQAARLAHGWMAAGLKFDPDADRLRRLNKLLDALENSIPESDALHQKWLVFARRWAELGVLWHEIAPPDASELGISLQRFRDKADMAFLEWVQKRYGSLYNQPPTPPVMLHHIPRMIARHMEETPQAKVALLVLDGLALDQWIIIRNVLAPQRSHWLFREDAVFAWLPTITPVSRQAAFAGKVPIYFPSSLLTTDKEPALWTQFWADHGLSPAQVGYAKGVETVGDVEHILSRPTIRVVGMVVDKVDKIMHGMELGTSGMHNQVRHWTQQGFLLNLLDLLFEQGFHVFLTADHGNIETVGCGRPAEGSIADLRGERVRMYSDASLRAQVKERFPGSIEWPGIGLPADYLPLFAADRLAFVKPDDTIVAHGGISIEELVVPLVQIEVKEW